MNAHRNNRLSSACSSSFLSIIRCLLFCLVTVVSLAVVQVENGVYKQLSLKVNDNLSKCHCDQIIENIKVGHIVENLNIILILEFSLYRKVTQPPIHYYSVRKSFKFPKLN